MEQMKPDGLEVVNVNYGDPNLPKSVRDTHPLVWFDHDEGSNKGAFCCVLGPDPQAGVFGCGDTLQQALAEFDRHFQELADHPVAGDPVSEFIQQRHV